MKKYLSIQAISNLTDITAHTKLAEQIERLQEHYEVINEKIEIYRQWEIESLSTGGS
jgi:hypothetical protein